jgi:tetratricopeptide (TPR) repeat protein
MKLSKLFFTIALFLFLLCLSFNSVEAKEEWVRVRSKNFQLIGNGAEKDIRQVAVKLEQFREFFRGIFSNVNFNSPIPINVIVFRDEKTFSNFKPVGNDGKSWDWAAGYFQSGEDVNYIVLSSEESDKAHPYSIIFHEYVHFLVSNDIGRSNAPPWFNEGLAEYYETFQIEDDQKVSLGIKRDSHLHLLQKNKLIPFETFFNMDNYTLHRQGKDGVGLFYAQAWALMHYLMQGNGGSRNQQLNKFIDLVLKGKTAKQAFSEAFQIEYATMESELKKYVEQKTYGTSIIKLKNKLVFENEMQSSPLSEAEAKAVLGDLLYYINRLPEAATLLEEALKLDSSLSLANSSLGLVKMQQGKFEEAEKYLEKAIALDNKNYLVHFQYAYVMSRQEMTHFGFVSGYDREQAKKMRESLKKAIALNPNFAESYNLYAFINVVRNEGIDEAFDYINKALKLAPGNQWHLVRLAEIYSRKEDFSNARRIAQKVFETAPDDHLRVYAKGTINNINSYEAQLEDIKNNRRRMSDVTDQPLTEEELARINEKVMRESINYNLRRPKAFERRVLGFLTKIECTAEEVIYSVRVDNRNLHLRSENFDSLFLMSYDGDMSNELVGCGTIKKESFAVVNYRPSDNPKAKSAGEIISIEFVPKNFIFLK